MSRDDEEIIPKPVFEEEAYDYFRHPGDPRPTRQTFNGRWGGVVRLVTAGPTPLPNIKPNPSATLIFVPTTNVPRPVAFQIRFSLDGVTWHATNPSSTATIRFKFTSQIDLKSAGITDQFDLSQDQSQPFSKLITTGTTLTAVMTSSDEFNPDALYVAVTACPVCDIDEDAAPTPPTPTPTTVRQAGWGFSGDSAELAVFRYTIAEIRTANQVPIPFPAFDAHADRCAFSFANDSSTKVYIGFGPSSGIVGEQFGSIVLNPGDTYEAPPNCYQGALTLSVDPDGPDDDDGCVLSTEGRYPA